ncbi:MAG: hypothetical protein CMI62_18570 [Parvibaculum sp.]|jgi:hypothetical protein|uniref:hypothetical protein n=1 Tax=Parvibaculum sp. TaxID=2024848 RepID=UPI000C57092A|nr:hypothetical protein [Parvibaculum sp.]MAC40107.1 hypothetical protein [Oceanicaulis sp.]MAU62722.1 hypothetical protein [Parvibaculum sp.]|tara:strand:- start:743 stop:1387 length:645 start_codon:yes stop_codon:yes gene_type:complete
MNDAAKDKEHEEEYGELLKFTLAGFAGGLVLGAVLDWLGFQRSGWGQWLVRTLSGEGESILEGIYALRQRLRGAVGSMAEAYGWGKVTGMVFPWIVDAGSRLAGIDVYGVEGFYIPWLYAMSDQMGANVAGFLYLRRKEGDTRAAASAYVRNPVMLASLLIVVIAPVGLLIGRLAGFSPETQILTAVETILGNLCWLPPLIGWWMERRERGEAA